MNERIYDRLQKSAVGFEAVFLNLSKVASDTLRNSFPAYDIEKTGDDTYTITMAVAGYTLKDLDITTEEGNLVVMGDRPKDDERREYVHKGITTRTFERKFAMEEYVVVKGATLENGLLSIDLAREVPEEKKPRKVEIKTASSVEEPAN